MFNQGIEKVGQEVPASEINVDALKVIDHIRKFREEVSGDSKGKEYIDDATIAYEILNKFMKYIEKNNIEDLSGEMKAVIDECKSLIKTGRDKSLEEHFSDIE